MYNNISINISNDSVHHNRVMDLYVKTIAQKAAMAYYGWSAEDFIKIFGRNYCDV
jgi:hypothetical protein